MRKSLLIKDVSKIFETFLPDLILICVKLMMFIYWNLNGLHKENIWIVHLCFNNDRKNLLELTFYPLLKKIYIYISRESVKLGTITLWQVLQMEIWKTILYLPWKQMSSVVSNVIYCLSSLWTVVLPSATPSSVVLLDR